MISFPQKQESFQKKLNSSPVISLAWKGSLRYQNQNTQEFSLFPTAQPPADLCQDGTSKKGGKDGSAAVVAAICGHKEPVHRSRVFAQVTCQFCIQLRACSLGDAIQKS